MIKQMTMIAATIGLALGANYAMASPSSSVTPPSNGAGAFVGAQVGYDSVTVPGDKDHDLSYGLRGGYRWGLTSNQSLGFDVGYQNLYDKTAHNDTNPSVPVNLKVKGTASNVGVNWRYSFIQDYGDVPFVVLRAGYLHAHLKEKATTPAAPGLSYSESGNSDGWYAGVAGGYDFTPNFSMTVGYDFGKSSFKHDVTAYTHNTYVAAQYRF